MIGLDRIEDIALVKLEHGKANALDPEFLDEIRGTFESLREDPPRGVILTAEGKMSAIVLAALPILLGGAMWALNPEYINTLFTASLGKILLGASITSALIGFAWMKKIIAIEI